MLGLWSLPLGLVISHLEFCIQFGLPLLNKTLKYQHELRPHLDGSWDWGTKSTRSSPRSSHPEEKDKGKSHCCLQLLRGKGKNIEPGSSQGCTGKE